MLPLTRCLLFARFVSFRFGSWPIVCWFSSHALLLSLPLLPLLQVQVSEHIYISLSFQTGLTKSWRHFLCTALTCSQTTIRLPVELYHLQFGCCSIVNGFVAAGCERVQVKHFKLSSKPSWIGRSFQSSVVRRVDRSLFIISIFTSIRYEYYIILCLPLHDAIWQQN